MPFRELSEDDQRFIIRIPETPYMGPLATKSADTGKKRSETPTYIENREKAIARLEIKLEEQSTELESITISKGEGKSSPRMRAKEKEVSETNAEITRLESQIKVYRSQNPN